MSEPIIAFRDVSLGYRRHVVLKGLTFEIEKGDFLGILGPNGSGKSTMLKAVLGIVRPIAGRIETAKDLRYGYVMQRHALDTLFPFTTEEIVYMGRFGRRRPWKRMEAQDRRIVDEALEITGTLAHRTRLYRELSGGQRQRVLMARALAFQPDVMLLDEPTNDMDVRGETRIMELVRRIKENLGVSIVLVSHHLHVVLSYSERIIFLAEGKALIHTPEELMHNDLLAKIYGLPLEICPCAGKKYLIAGE